MATAKTGTEGIAGAERAVMNAALADLKLPKIELAMVKAHTQTGQMSHEGYGIFLVGGARAALQHHKRLDASGYPQGVRVEIAGNQNSDSAADVVEAISSHRPYRPTRLEGAIAKIATNCCKFYDTALHLEIHSLKMLLTDQAYECEQDYY